ATLIEQLRALAATPGVSTPGAATPADPAAKPGPAAVRAGTTPAAQDADAATTQSEVVPAFSDRVADEAQQFVEDLMAGASTAVATFRALATGDSSRFTRLSGWPTAMLHMILVMVATIVAFLILRAVAARIYSRMDRWVLHHQMRVRTTWQPREASPPGPAHIKVEQVAAQGGLPAADATVELHGPPAPQVPPLHMQMQLLYGKAVAVVGGLIVDVAVILLAATVGYGVGLLATGDRGVLGPFERLRSDER